MLETIVADSWREVHPGARAGVLALRGVSNPVRNDMLDERKQQIEQSLRAQFAGKTKAELRTLDTIRPYADSISNLGRPTTS